MPTFDSEDGLNAGLIDLVTTGSVEEIEARLEEIGAPISQEVLAAVEKTGDYAKVQIVMCHISAYGVTEDMPDCNLLLWALSQGFLIAAGQLAEDAFSETLRETNEDGKTPLEVARELGADGVVADILACAESYGLNLE